MFKNVSEFCLTNYLLFIVDKMTQMVGSYAPKKDLQSYTTPVEDAPSGMLARGHYTVNSLFTDDDGHEHLKVYSFRMNRFSTANLNYLLNSGSGLSKSRRIGTDASLCQQSGAFI